jgi:hypothetical protein
MVCVNIYIYVLFFFRISKFLNLLTLSILFCMDSWETNKLKLKLIFGFAICSQLPVFLEDSPLS